MPLKRGKDYYQWGDSGKKYYYQPGDIISRKIAKESAKRQGIAIAIRKKISR